MSHYLTIYYIVKTSHRNDINWSSHGAFFQFSLMAMVCSLYASKLFAPYQRHKHGTHELLIMSRFVYYIYGCARFVI